MRRIDELHLKHPFFGSRLLAVTLRNEGRDVNRKRVQRLMRLMGIESMAPKPKTSEPHPEHAVYPYLLRGLAISRPNHVWATDITYIPMKAGFVYLVALMDSYSRRVLSWRVSNTLDSSFCVDALEEELDNFAQPVIFHTDPGAHVTAEAVTTVLLNRSIAITLHGNERCLDNVFVERLWRSLKYEEVYLHAYDNVAEARAGIVRYLTFYHH